VESKRTAADSEGFVRLIKVAKEDEETRERLLAILSLDSFNRVSLLNTYIGEMRLRGAPEELVDALESLLDNRVAEEALELLKHGRP
jgi:hypothetical protein